MASRRDHANKAEVLRRVLDAFPPEHDTSADRAVRQRVEGAVIASELASGEPVSLPTAPRPGPQKATSGRHRAR